MCELVVPKERLLDKSRQSGAVKQTKTLQHLIKEELSTN